MQYLKQFFIILAVSFIGEILNFYICLPIPASIYSLIIMLICLITKIIPLKSVKDASDLLIKIMPVMFVAPASGLMDSMKTIQEFLPEFLIIVFVSTILTMVVTGLTSEFIINKKEGGQKK